MKKEIADQTFWFPSIKLSRTLSPKTPKPGVEAAGELLLLGDYDCTVDTQPFRDALNDVVARLKTFTPQPADAGQSASYHGLAQFLTGCVKACHDALEVRNVFPPRQDRWYKDLEFTVGKPVVDGVEGAASLMPKITGGNGISAFAEEQLYWNPPKDKPTHMITLPVEVGKHWGAMISQAATYARCLFSASPMRVFVLVLAFNHESNVLQFLVFHRGGLTASGEYDITKTDGLTEVARLFLTLTSWGTAKDAGVITCCSENIYLLPGDQEGTRYVRAATEATLSRFHCVRGRATRVSRLRLPTNALPMAPSERPPEMARGGPGLTTRSPSRDASALLEVQEQTNDGHARTDPDAQLKYVQPKEIFRSEDDPILSELTGIVVVKTSWPGIDHRNNEAKMYRDSAGRFGTIPHVCSYEGVGEHREVISNILFVPQEGDIEQYHWPIFSDTPPEKPDIRTIRLNVFGVEGKSLVKAKSPRQLSRAWASFLLGWLSIYLSGYLHRDISIGNVLMTDKPVKGKKFEIPKEFQDHLESLQDQKAVEGIKELCRKVEELADGLGISDQCTAFVTDGDLAIPWSDSWTREHRATKSGTPEFMSRILYSTTEDYLHSPVDDLESCFWVSVWSVLFNKDNIGGQSTTEKRMREELTECLKNEAVFRFSGLWDRKKHSDITLCFRPMLIEWWKSVRDRFVVWSEEVIVDNPENADGEYYLPHFHRFALQGVVDVLQVLAKHWDGKVGWESWTAPTSSM